MKLCGAAARSKRNGSVLMAAAAPRSLCAIRWADVGGGNMGRLIPCILAMGFLATTVMAGARPAADVNVQLNGRNVVLTEKSAEVIAKEVADLYGDCGLNSLEGTTQAGGSAEDAWRNAES